MAIKVCHWLGYPIFLAI